MTYACDPNDDDEDKWILEPISHPGWPIGESQVQGDTVLLIKK